LASAKAQQARFKVATDERRERVEDMKIKGWSSLWKDVVATGLAEWRKSCPVERHHAAVKAVEERPA
jgi:hypothetical protein